MLTTFSHLLELPAHDICVVGAGPVGLATALACEDAGLRVLLLESGKETPDVFSTGLTAGHAVDPARHAAPHLAACRGLGGTSRWWGGRCVAFDDIDFADRPQARDAAWPIAHHEVQAFYPAAGVFFGIGPARFEAAPQRTPALENVRFDSLERWTPEINMGVRYRKRLEASQRVTVVLGATVVDLTLDAAGRKVNSLTVAGRTGRVEIAPTATVLACGGLETPRLLLAAQRRRPEAFGGAGGPLGRGYMGHLSGKIADIVLVDPGSVIDHDFFIDGGVFARRRFQLTTESQLRAGVLNAAFWADNPPFYAADHRNGVLSLAWGVLAFPFIGRQLVSEGVRLAHVGPPPHAWGPHIWNVISSPWSMTVGILAILHARFLMRPRKPGFLVRNTRSRYALHYHAEHAPNTLSRVKLSARCDGFGLPFLDGVLHFTERDAESVVSSHEVLDVALRLAGAGRLGYRHADRAERVAAVLEQATDGFHQAGTTRMAASAAEGVVDSDCRVHGVDNLWIAGCSVLPSSGQASPTFVAAALGIRLARHLAVRHAVGRTFA
jgi:choline dehydrogenase-like flavoprotein